MGNKMALELIELGLQPVLLGWQGDDLKRPLHKGWQTAAYTTADVSTWPSQNNIGIRCGLQPSLSRACRGSRSLLVFDFDEEANRIFPIWRAEAEKIIGQECVIVTSGRGWYSFTEEMGGGLPELIAWHQSIVGEGAC